MTKKVVLMPEINCKDTIFAVIDGEIIPVKPKQYFFSMESSQYDHLKVVKVNGESLNLYLGTPIFLELSSAEKFIELWKKDHDKAMRLLDEKSISNRSLIIYSIEADSDVIFEDKEGLHSIGYIGKGSYTVYDFEKDRLYNDYQIVSQYTGMYLGKYNDSKIIKVL